MSILHHVVDVVAMALAALAALSVGYLLVLTAAAATYRPRGAAPSPSNRRYAILVPAHNEAQTIDRLLDSFAALDHPADRFAVHVVADNCTDATADIARGRGVVVHERTNTTLVGKGFALDWLLERVLATDAPDVIVYMDADAVAPANMLTGFDAAFDAGARVVQAHYAVSSPFASWATTMRSAAMLLVNYVRPLGRRQLGLSAGLKGTGMAMEAGIARSQRWGGSLAEDTEYHARLLLDGLSVTFVPEVTVTAEMPSTLAGSVDQNRRWEAGRLAAARQLGPRLLASGLATLDGKRIDAALDLLIPPLSSLAALIVAGALLGLWIAPAAGLVFVLCGLGLAAHVLLGLAVARADAAYYKALVKTPLFLAWKIPVYAGVIGRGPQTWIRTTREPSGPTGADAAPAATGSPANPSPIDGGPRA